MSQNTAQPDGGPAAGRVARAPDAEHRAAPEPELLPGRSVDEREVGWGDEGRDPGDDWYLDERPPHHGGS